MQNILIEIILRRSGSTYVGSQGTYALVKATYKELISNGDSVNANNVALAFVKDGTYHLLID